MNLNQQAKRLSNIKRWVAMAIFGLFVTLGTWQTIFFANGNDTRRAKDFVQDTKERVQKTAKGNANKVDQATDNETDFIGSKAKKDQGRIEAKAEKDSARTQKAINKTENAVKRTVDNIKDSLGG
jgi:cytoskeletal protein RodZ